MFTRLDRSHDGVLGISVTDRLTVEEIREIHDQLEEVVQHRGSVRILVRMGDLDSVQPEALWEDLKKTPDYSPSIARLAVVGDQHWHRFATRLATAVATSRFFLPEHEDEAWEWLGERHK